MIYILLPAFNEEKSLSSLFKKFNLTFEKYKVKYKIVVCDDGSLDNTKKVLNRLKKNFPLIIINHKINRGLGETMRDLFEYVSYVSNSEDIIIRMDCDDTHEPIYIPDMVKKISEGYDVVIASRFLNGGDQYGVNKYRSIISFFENLFIKIFFQIKNLKEYSCGYRAYKASIIKKAISFYGNDFIQLKGLGFTCTLEKLIKLKIIGAKFAEIPFILKYDQKVSSSKMISSITTLGYLVMTILYHWPFGGWKNGYKQKLKKYE